MKEVAQTATITTNGATTADDAALVDGGVWVKPSENPDSHWE